MNIRKFFGMPSKAQEKLYKDDMERVKTICSKIADRKNTEKRSAQSNADGTCPHCGARKDIVNKIRRVEGSGHVGGNLFGVSGSISIDTNDVSHCNACGNEWKKGAFHYTWGDDVLKEALNYLSDLLEDPKNLEYSWKITEAKLFDGCYAETVYWLGDKCSNKVYMSTNETLTMRRLRRYYKSVFDTPENMEKLQKLY
jgi:ribosomal protein L37AE/L43A